MTVTLDGKINEMTQVLNPDTQLHDEIDVELSSLSPLTKDIALNVHDKIRKADSRGEISKINRIFFESLKPNIKSATNVTKESLALLDKANIYTWLSYTLYDDVFDEGNIHLLSSANILMRLALTLYQQAGINSKFANHYFSIVDEANALELSLRSKKGSSTKTLKPLLYQKSIAHCIGQIWIAEQAHTPRPLHINKAFECYCSARQLSDDIFDWREDIANNHQNFATATIRNDALKLSPQFHKLDKTTQMNIAFWHISLETLCSQVKSFADDGMSILDKALSKDSAYVNAFIKPLYNSAASSIDKHLSQKKELNLDTSGIIAP